MLVPGVVGQALPGVRDDDGVRLVGSGASRPGLEGEPRRQRDRPDGPDPDPLAGVDLDHGSARPFRTADVPLVGVVLLGVALALANWAVRLLWLLR